MSRPERIAKLWAEYHALDRRRAKAEAERKNAGYLSRQMILLKARIIKLEMAEEKQRVA